MIPNPWVLLGTLVSALALATGGYFYGHHVEALAFEAYKAQQAAVAEKAEATAQAGARAAEQTAAAQLAATDSNYEDQINELKKRRDALVAAVASDNERLYVHIASPSGNGVPRTAAGSAGRDDATTAELSPDTSAVLIDLATRADAVADQLGAAQQVIVQDRKTCNGGAQ